MTSLRRLCLLAVLLLPQLATAQVTALRLSTTTSTENSGLLARLLPPFEQRFNIAVDVIAVGSGAALKLADNGDVDVTISHAPELEAAFLASGKGVNPRSFMYNHFVIVGPPEDPAGLASLPNLGAGLQRLAASEAAFVSRGDESGTHIKERQLWQASGLQPKGRWYRSAGQGMGQVLVMASEMNAYTLTDRGTFLTMQHKLTSKIVLAGDPPVHNPYTIMAVNPARHAGARYLEAMQLIAWVTSREGQQIIRDFRVAGEPVFIPTAIP